MSQQFDVIVIGGGPGGYIAAIRAAQLGFKVACIDEWKNAKGGAALGGTCTNVGCIPSKALLQSSEHYEHAGKHFAEHGIEVKGLSLDVGQMLKRKDHVVEQNNKGIEFLFKKNKVAFFHGRGSFVKAVPPGEGGTSGSTGGYEIKAGEESLVGKQVIVATGSNARALPGAPFDEENILSNDGALRVGAVPKKLGLIGSGVIGLEMGSVWRRLGAEVTILEGLPTFLGAVDEQIAKEAKKAFDKQGLKIELGVKVGEVKSGKKGVSIAYTTAKGEAQTLEVDKLIVSIGRVPNTIGLNAEGVGLQLDERGAIVVDGDCRTNLPGVWAVGDVVRGPMLAHKAEEEGVAVAERIAGQHGHVNFNTIPWVIYTSPEIAWVGETEQQLKARGAAYKAGTFPFMANGRARALGDTTGMVKFLADAATDEILGVHIVGPMASELISEAVVAMEFKASSEDIARICHAHPSLSEATKEAALAVDKRSLNF
ncbi:MULTISPECIES: dihydrolipoyl dehydrogenase [unclassified Hydrogenophaga]|uniref:dihydrolipoyl dehydrogenase n=1 Tax=unclassified Hydrogenophaga TaxID=2610897 RepID=UPI000962F333|nr:MULTISPECIES: dihydrolipoyl dehydrogenase [unclassified Hydrogenophaga]MBN9371633.1 dihydrolipoyl dehydrogenase [Hydrogenophaga sp.]OJV56588.1 MAG: dihydrolipoyl dehydrogenase [Hydrogenophaga sp. 70-12]